MKIMQNIFNQENCYFLISGIFLPEYYNKNRIILCLMTLDFCVYLCVEGTLILYK